MTRSMLLSLLLVLAPSCSAVDSGNAAGDDSKMTWRILASGSHSGAASAGEPQKSAPRVEIARSQEEYERLWDRLIRNGERPPAAFDEESVIFLLGGVQSTGGYRIDPRDVELEGDRLIMDVRVEGPPPGAIVTQAFTAPWALVAVNRREFVEAQWVEDGRVVARRSPADQAQ